MPIPELLRSILVATGPSGNETEAARAWRDGCSDWAAQVGVDNVGSSHARVAGIAGGPTLAIVGHIDEIGLIVSHIDDEGFLRFQQVGGWDPMILVGQRVRLMTREGPVLGVIGRKPVHLLRDDDRKQTPETRSMHIDIGAKDGDDARSRVRLGDVAVIDADPVEYPNDRLVARALDNRVGCYVAAEAARLVAGAGGAPGDVIALAVTQEETNFAGARTSAYSLNPDVAIVVDGTFATDQPGIELGETTKHPLGSGPAIERGASLHPKVFELLYETAEAEGIPFTVSTSGRNTGTDADAVNMARNGIPTGLVCVPMRYMHSSVEMVELADIDAVARLLAAFATRLEPGMSFER
jgi:putative aminopeptidase FrvX